MTTMDDRIFLSAVSHLPNVRNYLKQIGTRNDLERTQLVLKEGLRVKFYSDDGADDGTPDDLLFEGTVHFDDEKKLWYALLDPDSFHHRSEELKGKSRVSNGLVS
jgi:hypothetical protein